MGYVIAFLLNAAFSSANFVMYFSYGHQAISLFAGIFCGFCALFMLMLAAND